MSREELNGDVDFEYEIKKAEENLEKLKKDYEKEKINRKSVIEAENYKMGEIQRILDVYKKLSLSERLKGTVLGEIEDVLEIKLSEEE